MCVSEAGLAYRVCTIDNESNVGSSTKIKNV
jgi:hypothetical protein